MMQRSPSPATLGRFTAAQLDGLSLAAKHTRGQIISIRTRAEMAREAAHARRVEAVTTLAALWLFGSVALIMLGML